MSRTAAELPRLASPDSIAELSELMARAHAESRTVTVFGGGTAFDDHPPAATPGLLIDMTGLAEVAEGPADGPTVRAEAGAKISALNGLAARSGQEVLADLPDDRIGAGASLGGMIATAAAGPRHLNRPRLAETVVSMTSVGADGTIARTADGLSPRSGRSRAAAASHRDLGARGRSSSPPRSN
jgi:glycolate oxidase FAD binding subunit